MPISFFSLLFILKMVSIHCQTMHYVLCTSLENSPQINPIIGRIECKAGHGAGRPTQKMVKSLIIILSSFHSFVFSVSFFLTVGHVILH